MSVKGLIAADDQIARAVVISLFTWRRAEPSDPVDDEELYGYWGDAYPDVPRDRIGSRLWLLRRRTLTAETIRDADRYAREALAWMVEDEIVQAVNVRSVRTVSTRLDLTVILTFDDDRREMQFDDVMRMINVV